MTTEQIITQDPEIHGGLPVFTGTRVPVKSLIDHLKAGDSLDYFKEILHWEARYLKNLSEKSRDREQAVIVLKEKVETRKTPETPEDYLSQPELRQMAKWKDRFVPSKIDKNPPGLIEKITGEAFGLDDVSMRALDRALYKYSERDAVFVMTVIADETLFLELKRRGYDLSNEDEHNAQNDPSPV